MAAAVALGSSLTHFRSFNGEASRINPNTSNNNISKRSNRIMSFTQSTRNIFLRGCDYHWWTRKRRRCYNDHVGSVKKISPVMEWQDCSSSIEVDVPCSIAYECYSDRESIPKWMTFISSVKILEDKPDLSRWSMKYQAFGQDLEFSWLARNMQPIPNQKIHWRSLEGLPNSGSVRFFPKGQSSCRIELTISYEVPQILVPVTAALRPLMEMLLTRGLESFAEYTRETYGKKAS